MKIQIAVKPVSKKKLDALAKALPGWQDKAVHAFAVEIANRIRRGILKEAGGFQYRLRKLDDRYVSRKQREGLETSPLVATRAYANSIIARRVAPKVSVVTVKAGTHPNAGLTYAELANYLENGTRNMDPLPHWRPVVESRGRRLAKRFFGSLHGAVSIT